MNLEGCESVVAYFKAISQHFPVDTEVNHEEPVRLANLWAENHILNHQI
jgi:hypothetical protein